MIRRIGPLFLSVLAVLTAQNDYLRWDQKKAKTILTEKRVVGQVGKSLDLRVTSTDRSVNYKVRATWMTPKGIRACARLEQLRKGLSDQETLKAVADADAVAGTVMLIEIHAREGSGIIPSTWYATLGPKTAPDAERARGQNSPKLREFPALSGISPRDYGYDLFWVVFPLISERSKDLFTSDDLDAELTVNIDEKSGRMKWRVPEDLHKVARATPDTTAQ